MTKAQLVEKLRDVPDNANILVWNEREDAYAPVTDADVYNEKAFDSDVQVHLYSFW